MKNLEKQLEMREKMFDDLKIENSELREKIQTLQANLTIMTETAAQFKAEKVKKGKWIEIGVSEFDDADKCYKCSVCGKEINGYDIGYYFKFCHGCGAEMKGGK